MAAAEDVLRTAAGEIGYSRWTDPEPGTKYGRWYADLTKSSYFGTSGVPYCAMFVSWVLARAGAKCSGFPTASCPSAVSAATSGGRIIKDKRSAATGDVVIFDWPDVRGPSDHVGIVEINKGHYIQTIEGNTSPGSGGSQGNGGGVYRRTRDWGVVQCVIRPDYDGSPAPQPAPSWSCGPLGESLSMWGPLFTNELQRQRGTVVDGVISGQPRANAKYFWAVEDSTRRFGSGGSQLIASLQGLVGVETDGYYGPASIKAHQRWLNAKLGAGLAVDGYHGEATNRAMATAMQRGLYR